MKKIKKSILLSLIVSLLSMNSLFVVASTGTETSNIDITTQYEDIDVSSSDYLKSLKGYEDENIRDFEFVETNGTKTHIHVSKKDGEVTIVSDSMSSYEIELAKKEIEKNLKRDKFVQIMPLAEISPYWKYHSTDYGSTSFAIHTFGLVLSIVLACMNLSKAAKVITSGVEYIVQNLIPTAYYRNVKYYKHDPYLMIENNWTWYSNPGRTSYIFSYTSVTTYYD